MHRHETGRATEQTCAACCGCEANDFFASGVGAAVVGHSQFHTNHGRNHDDILLHTAGQRHRGICVSTGQGIGSNTFLIQCASLCHKVFNAACNTICAKKTDHRGDAVGGKDTQLRFGDAGSRSLLTTTTGDMDMEINVTGQNLLALHIENLHIGERIIALNVILHAADLVADNQNILLTQVFRCIDISIFNQFNHLHCICSLRYINRCFETAPRRKGHRPALRDAVIDSAARRNVSVRRNLSVLFYTISAI